MSSQQFKEKAIKLAENIINTTCVFYDDPNGGDEYSCPFCSSHKCVKRSESVSMSELSHSLDCPYLQALEIISQDCELTYNEKLEIYERAESIVRSDISWDMKYDMIFSSEISQKFTFEWYDPDCDYEDDVRA